MTHEFDGHIAVSRQGPATWDADLSAGWLVGGGVNGGYLLAVIGNALRHTFPDKPDPIAVSAYYLSASSPGPATVSIDVRREGGTARDRVAHFHLSNGSRIERLNWLADTSPKGLSQSAGMMVNYLYKLDDIEANHEAYRGEGKVMTSSSIRSLLKA